MRESILMTNDGLGDEIPTPVTWVHTLVVGSGAAGLNCAIQLRQNGVRDVLLLSEGLDMGTSINTGSDKQTYYKLSMCGEDADSPAIMAETYFSGGSMHGDLALVEAALSPRAFLHLVNLGVPFPRDRYGQFIGYKTDHDPRQRATSIGPYTSKEMCRALIRRIVELSINVRESRTVIELLTIQDRKRGQSSPNDTIRAAGVLALREDGTIELYAAENIVFAVGGPGGLYQASVYPEVHTGGIGMALRAGAMAQGLPESQYGLASTRFRWNVSGTYMQVVPRFISTDPDGVSNRREFMREYFATAGEMNSMVFLKGYQWPFDSRKVRGGSSLVDILVYIETVLRKRRVFLDFTANPEDFAFDKLSPEALDYLTRSQALLPSPIERLRKMNPAAIELYHDHGIDITKEPLEIAVCAQHNNGGLAADCWWHSLNIKRLFPIGEVNGSHGIYRPGGSALNSGQVGAIRAAEYIANRCIERTLDKESLKKVAQQTICNTLNWLDKCARAKRTWQQERDEFQQRMSKAGAHIRSLDAVRTAVTEAWNQVRRIEQDGCSYADNRSMAEALKNRYLCFAHAVYLDAVQFSLESGTGSRGSAIALDHGGEPLHDRLDDFWRIVREDPRFREMVQQTLAGPDGVVRNEWVPRRPLPKSDSWFETGWAAFRKGDIYTT